MATFTLPQPMTLEQARQAFLGSAPKYRGVDGLVRKHYVRSEDGRSVGGVYLWCTREQAEAAYGPEWRRFVREKYGVEPSVQFWDCPVIVDNVIGEIWSDA